MAQINNTLNQKKIYSYFQMIVKEHSKNFSKNLRKVLRTSNHIEHLNKELKHRQCTERLKQIANEQQQMRAA